VALVLLQAGMTFHRPVLAASVLLGFFVACGGKTVGSGGNGNPINPVAPGQGSPTPPVAACVNVTISAADLACSNDNDCVSGESGDICNGDCYCGGTAMNKAAEQRATAETSSIAFGTCHCPLYGTPACRGGQCVLCGIDGCTDGGIEAGTGEGGEEGGQGETEGGQGGFEGGVSPPANPNCADIANKLCAQAAACVSPTQQNNGICVVVEHSITTCFPTLADCETNFTNCGSVSGPGFGAVTYLPDPNACADALPGVACAMEGSDAEFFLPQSCASCGNTPLGCGTPDAG
jgi:hypothetical protein